MPPIGVPLDLLLDYLYWSLVTRLGLTIGLSILWQRIKEFDLKRLSKFMDLIKHK
jgi:hypothetical protein